MKIKSIIESLIFCLITIPIVYLGITFGLQGDFMLSPTKTAFAITLGIILGAFIMPMILLCHASKKVKILWTGRIIGLIIEAVIFIGVYIFSSGLAGLRIGEVEETTTLTEAQISLCKSEMYLNPSSKIVPLGFKLESGIDDAIWFKFKTNSTGLSQVFDTTVVDTTKFKKDFTFLHEMKELKWWDVKGKSLLGGQVSLPKARYMNVGVEEIDNGYMIYIMWHET